MRRKLVKQGQNALTVTLPREWCVRNDLKVGDEVEINSEDSILEISSTGKIKSKIVTVKIDEWTDYLIHRLITNLYKNGVQELHLEFKQKLPTSLINKTLHDLTIGFELTDIKEKSCIIRALVVEDEESFNVSTRKCFLLIRQAQEIILEDLKNKKFDSLEEIENLRQSVQRLTNFSIRLAWREGVPEKKRAHIAAIFSNVHRYGNRLKDLYSELQYVDQKIVKTLFEHFSHLYDTYYSKKLESINSFRSGKAKMMEMLTTGISKKNSMGYLQIMAARRNVESSVGHLIMLIEN